MRLIIILYTFFFLFAILKQHYVAALLILITVPFAFLISKLIIKNRISSYKNKILAAKEKFDKNIKFSPFINPNKAPYYILDLIPGVTTACAKGICVNRKKRKIKSFVAFADFCHLDLSVLDFVEKILKF